MEDELKAASAALKAAKADGDPEEIANAESRVKMLRNALSPPKAASKAKK